MIPMEKSDETAGVKDTATEEPDEEMTGIISTDEEPVGTEPALLASAMTELVAEAEATAVEDPSAEEMSLLVHDSFHEPVHEDL